MIKRLKIWLYKRKHCKDGCENCPYGKFSVGMVEETSTTRIESGFITCEIKEKMK